MCEKLKPPRVTKPSPRQRAEEATPSPTSPSARHTSVSTATCLTTPRRTSCGCRASPAATCTPSPPSPWTPSPGRTSPPPSSHGNSSYSGRSSGRGSSERWVLEASAVLKVSERSRMDFVLRVSQVHLCEAEGLPEFLGEGSPLPDRDGRSVLVAVKQLRADATSQARYL